MQGEYMLADSAYALSGHCIPAYKAPAANARDNAEFNYCLVKSRVRVEHCIGILKSRWASLREMRQQIHNARDMQLLVRWIVACCVLHNMLAQLGDAWSVHEYPYVGPPDPPADVVLAATNQQRTSREHIKTITLRRNYATGVLPIKQAL